MKLIFVLITLYLYIIVMVYFNLVKKYAAQAQIILYFRAFYSGWMLSCHGDRAVVITFSEPVFENSQWDGDVVPLLPKANFFHFS